MNKAILVGRITRELELRKTQTNKSVLSFSIAISKGKDKVEYVDIQCWEQRADYLNQYASKGTLISVIGRIESSAYVNKTGQKVKSTYVVAEEVSILAKPQAKENSYQPPVNNFSPTDFADEDLPFM